ncbi:MAG: FAD-binding oxidoreductase [Candidatus Bathyarchaeia archaeon]|nr:FAD-binding oxidoreductase [Candidatus Bathyarchaeota archaeon]
MVFDPSMLEESVKDTPFAAMYPDILAMFPEFKNRMSEQLKREVVGELKRLIGDENVSDNPAVCASYGAVPFLVPEIVIRPKEVEHVQAALRIANKHIIPVTPVAGGCLLSASSTFCIPRGIVLDMSGMNRIIEINTDEGYVVLEPGVTNGQLYKALQPLKYWHSKGSYNPQLSVFGPATTQVQGHRGSGGFDDILGFEVVLPDGTLVRTGGAVAEHGSWAHQYFNFPDIHGLWLNANGMLGVVTKFALRIYPQGEVANFHITGFNSTESAVKFCRQVCLRGAAEHVVIWHWVALLQMERWGKMLYGNVLDGELIPYDTWSPRNFYDPPEGVPLWLTVTTFEGFKEVVEAQIKVCDRLARENGGTVYNHEDFKRVFPYFYEMCVERHVKHEPPRSPAMALGLMAPFFTAAYIGLVPPRNLVQMEKHLVDLFEGKEGMSLISAYIQPFDQGRMMFHRFYISRFGGTFNELREDLRKYATYSAELLRKYGFFGHKPPATREEAKAILQQTGGYYEVLKRIKKALDPNNIMSPHMWPE